MEQQKVSLKKNNLWAEIEPYCVIQSILRNFWMVIMTALLGMMAAYVFLSLSTQPSYSCSATFAVTTRTGSNAASFTSGTADQFASLLTSTSLLDTVSKEIGVERKEVSVKASAISGTNLIKLTVSGKEPKTVYEMANGILKHYSDYSQYVFSSVVLKPVQMPDIPSSGASVSGQRRTILLAGPLGALLMAAVLAVLTVISGTVQTSNGARTQIDGTMLGLIGHVKKRRSLRMILSKTKTSLLISNPATGFGYTEAIQQVVSQLVVSFRRSTLLQSHIRVLLEKGVMYRVCNGNLLYHGCIPMEPDGSFSMVTVGGQTCAGRELMEVCDRLVRTAMYDRKEENTDFLWYLWCGPCSPLNGKDKIATFERTFLAESEAGQEAKNPYYTLWNKVETAENILREFGVDPQRGHIINGHVPVKKSRGEEPVKAGGKFINIDGGLSKAYQPVTGICGYTLVFTSHELYLAEHQQFDIDSVGQQQNGDMISRTIMIEQYPDRLCVRDTDGGADVISRIHDLEQLLAAYRSGIIRTPTRME